MVDTGLESRFMSNGHWQTPLPLPRGEVHVWALPLAVPAEERSELFYLLDDGERERVGRYHHAASREEFTVSRARLRQLLGRYLGVRPTAVRFDVSSTGKPTLHGGGGLHFNVSHSHGMALIALTRWGEVGVDVERVRHYPTHLDMAERYFTRRESAALRWLPGGQSVRAFFQVWTRKEAFLKATGLGLSGGLERFEVAVPPDDPARILHIDGDEGAGARWSLYALDPGEDHVGALAIEGRGLTVRLWRW